jgi:tetratricopeptide (TPR) repeat protein
VPQVLDLEQSLLLLELEPPFGKREVQIARRKMAKRWHPDIAPPGRQHEHERHLKAINEAADQLESLAEGMHDGHVSRNAVRASAAAAKVARAEAGRRAYEAEQRARANAADRAKNDPFGARVPDHSVVHKYARCLSYPEWGVGTVGIRTVPAGSLQFVDFSKPDPGSERVERFVTAAQHAMHEGDFDIAAKRLVYARDADPQNTTVLRMLTMAFWQAGNLEAAARSVRDWARADRDRPAPHRDASRIYEDMRAYDLAAEAAERAAERAPSDADAWERVGRLRLRLMQRGAALDALERARRLGPSLQALLDLALAYHLAGDVGGEVSATTQAVQQEPESLAAWSRHAHALARTERLTEGIQAAERASALGGDAEVADLLERLRAQMPRVLPGAA